MKNYSTLIKASAVAVFLAFLFFNVGTTRCAPPSDHLEKAQSQVRKAKPRMGPTHDQNLEEDNHQKFQLVEWLIMQSLMSQYQKLEGEENLEDDLN